MGLLALGLFACSSGGGSGDDLDTQAADTSDVTATPDTSDADTGDTDVVDRDTVDSTDTDGAGDSDATPGIDADDGDASDVEVNADAVPDADAAPVISGLSVIPNPANALSAYVEWATDLPALSALHVSCALGEEEFTITAPSESAGTNHRAFVMGLVDGASCDVTATSINSAGEASESAQWDVGPLPDILPELEVVVLGEEAIEPGWTLVNLNNHFDEVPLYVALVDEHGRFRWYFRNPESGAGSDNEVTIVDVPGRQGVLIGGTRNTVRPKLVGWDGNVLWQKNTSQHHDIRVLDGGERIAALVGGGPCETEHASGGIDIRTWDEWEIEWSWRLCTHYTPPSDFADWAHLNTIEPTAEGWLLSARDQYTLFHVDGETGEILWSVGERGTIETSAEAGTAFWRQHAPELQPGGTILLFDNGHSTHRASSRLLELAVDPDEGTVDVAWEWSPDPSVFAPIWGDADRLPNGNTLGTFGLRSVTEHTHLYEVTHDGEVVWHVRLPLRWGVYRSDRVPPQMVATFE